ncbi:polymer-forming cytoskeletal protein [Aquisalimonas lutea]|uniref:bactofilin family protein n=1 Tax=Aquisalimonas lutea TaxID=1327750 RepID=UPI0025B42953|nr:polymer-forming cytoskeletal protein [Aquisalimonas lutea]MDN3517730.1 polymer-forming cytoskeletal protein [Aquisalimonas lutea]
MAMFDMGRRGSGSEHERELEDEALSDNAGVGPVAPDWEAPGKAGVRSREAAVIGPSIHIDGTLKGEEDLLIEGRVTGTVQLREHSLTVGSKGQVEANVYAHTIMVEGQVDGDLYGSERVGVRSSARVRGNITAPRVSLEDGARFKGAIEMDPEAVEAALGTRGKADAKAGAEPGTGAGRASTAGPGASATGAEASSGQASSSQGSPSPSAGGQSAGKTAAGGAQKGAKESGEPASGGKERNAGSGSS